MLSEKRLGFPSGFPWGDLGAAHLCVLRESKRASHAFLITMI